MRSILIVIWMLVGLCLFLPGCRASLTGSDLEASVEINAPGIQAPEVYEGRYDKDRDKPE